MPRAPAWLQGIPELPFTRTTSYVGADVLVQLTFLNTQNAAVTPNSISYELDSLTTATNIIGQTSVAPTGSQQVLQIPGSKMQVTRQYLGRENFQLWITANLPDTNASSGSINVQQVVLIELINIAVPPL